MQQYQQDFSIHAVRSRGLLFGDFTLKSGRGSSYFYNSANTIKTGQEASITTKAYADMIQQRLEEGFDFDFLHGPAYKGIPLAGMTADELAERGYDKRFGFDLKEEIIEEEEIPVWEILKNLKAEIIDEVIIPEYNLTGNDVREIGKEYANRLAEQNFDLVFGESYGGIVPAAVITKKLWEMKNIDRRWAYNRKAAKGYGDKQEKLIIGNLMEGDKIIVVKSHIKPDGKIFGNLKDGDRVSDIDDVVTTGITKIKEWELLQSYRRNLKPSGIYISLDRQEVTETGESPVKMIERMGFFVDAILQARPMFNFLYGKEIDGKIPVNDETYVLFQGHKKEFGVKE
jgi:orotate phosphoribosyltransferase